MKENWFLIGDIHGEVAPVAYFYNQNRERLSLDECHNNIILLGDVGCNYSINGSRDYEFKQQLSSLPFTYICLRGNHEARVKEVMKRFPHAWEEKNKYDGTIYVEKDFPDIEYLSDIPGLYNFSGYRTLSIPGAYSVDKWYRLRNHWQWFADEQLSEQEMEQGRKLMEEGPVDLVISHTCPIQYEPRDLFLKSLNQTMIDKTMERYLGEIECKLDYKRWAWGHYHDDRLYPWDDDREKLMLFNETVVNLVKFMEMDRTNCLDDIRA